MFAFVVETKTFLSHLKRLGLLTLLSAAEIKLRLPMGILIAFTVRFPIRQRSQASKRGFLRHSLGTQKFKGGPKHSAILVNNRKPSIKFSYEGYRIRIKPSPESFSSIIDYFLQLKILLQIIPEFFFSSRIFPQFSSKYFFNLKVFLECLLN